MEERERTPREGRRDRKYGDLQAWGLWRECMRAWHFTLVDQGRDP